LPYFPYNKEGQAKYAPQSKGQFLVNIDKNQLFSVPNDRDGEYHFRLLPPWSQEGAFAISSDTHYNVGVPPTTFRCTNSVQPGSCKFCNVHALLRSEYEKYKIDITEISAKKRFYSNIVNLDVPAAGVLVFPYGITIYKFIMTLQENGNFGDITDPKNGHNLTLYRTKQGRRTNDVIMPDPKPSKISNPAWLDQLHNLDIILPEPSLELSDRAFASHPFKVWSPDRTIQKNTVQQATLPVDDDDDDIPDFPTPQGDSRVDHLKQLEKMKANMKKAAV
jgi:hypothetical protein